MGVFENPNGINKLTPIARNSHILPAWLTAIWGRVEWEWAEKIYDHFVVNYFSHFFTYACSGYYYDRVVNLRHPPRERVCTTTIDPYPSFSSSCSVNNVAMVLLDNSFCIVNPHYTLHCCSGVDSVKFYCWWKERLNMRAGWRGVRGHELKTCLLHVPSILIVTLSSSSFHAENSQLFPYAFFRAQLYLFLEINDSIDQ